MRCAVVPAGREAHRAQGIIEAGTDSRIGDAGSASTSLMMPRFLTKTSTKASCSALRRWKRPSWKRPSIWVSQLPQCSRVTASSSPHTGQRPITGCSVTGKTPSFRRSSDVSPALEEIDSSPAGIDKLLHEIDFVNICVNYDNQRVPHVPHVVQNWLLLDVAVQGRHEASFSD